MVWKVLENSDDNYFRKKDEEVGPKPHTASTRCEAARKSFLVVYQERDDKLKNRMTQDIKGVKSPVIIIIDGACHFRIQFVILRVIAPKMTKKSD